MEKEKKAPFFILMLSGFIDYAGVALVYPLFAFLLFDRSLNFVPAETSDAMRGLYLGILVAIQPLAQFLSSPYLGLLSDYKGRKRVFIWTLIVGLVGYGVALLGVWANSLILLGLYRLIVGFSCGNASIISAIVADLSTPETKAKNYGLLHMAFGSGFTIAPFLGGFLYHQFAPYGWGFSAPFALTLLLVVLNLVLVIWKLQETCTKRLSGKVSIFAGFHNLSKGLKMVEMRGIFFALLLYTFGWAYFTEFIPVFLIERFGFTPDKIGSYYGYTGIFYSLSAGFLIHPVIRKIGARRSLIVSLILTGSYVFLMIWIRNPLLLWVYLPFSQFLMAFIYPTSSTVISNQASEEHQGEVMGIYQSVVAFGFGLSPLVSGIFVGAYPVLAIVIGSLGMATAGVIFAVYSSDAVPATAEDTDL